MNVQLILRGLVMEIVMISVNGGKKMVVPALREVNHGMVKNGIWEIP